MITTFLECCSQLQLLFIMFSVSQTLRLLGSLNSGEKAALTDTYGCCSGRSSRRTSKRCCSSPGLTLMEHSLSISLSISKHPFGMRSREVLVRARGPERVNGGGCLQQYRPVLGGTSHGWHRPYHAGVGIGMSSIHVQRKGKGTSADPSSTAASFDGVEKQPW